MQKHPTHTRTHSGARLGQHFLTRPEIAGWVADAVPLTHDSVVLEIGPGHGILTRELLIRAGKVIAIEKDSTLVAELRDTFATEIEQGRLTLIGQDIRDFDPSQYSVLNTQYSVLANIPYYLTGYIIRKFLTVRLQPVAMALLIQKEVAERIVARDGKHSLLSLSVHAYGTPRIMHIVKAGAFSPPPKVDSAVLSITDISRNRFTDSPHEERFYTLLHTAFGSKRKQVGSTLSALMNTEKLEAAGIPKTARPEDVQLEEWLLASRT